MLCGNHLGMYSRDSYYLRLLSSTTPFLCRTMPFIFISHRKWKFHELLQFSALPFVYLLALAPISEILTIQSFSSNAMLIYSYEILIPESSTFCFPPNPLAPKHANISATSTHFSTHSLLWLSPYSSAFEPELQKE